jgi:RND family efflux transporter MFP subunit
VDQLAAQCEECEAVLVDAQADLQRAQLLVERNATSTKDVEDAQRAVATALAARKRTQAALKLAEAGPTAEQIEVAQAQLELAKADVALKREMVEKCTIRCPLEKAWIVERFVGGGDHVTANPSTPLLRVVDSSILLAQVNVPERYQGLIRVEDRASVMADAVQAGADQVGAVDAMVVLVNAQIDPDTRTFRVRVGIDNSQDLFKAGTFVRVQIPVRTVAEAVVVPAETVAFANGEPAAFVVRDGVVDRVPLKLGISNRTHYQVVSGLSPDDQVVSGDLSLLAPGLRVRATSRGPTQTGTAAAESTPAVPTQG